MKKLVITGLLALAMQLGVNPAEGADERGRWMSMCKAEAKAVFGEDTRVKFKKFLRGKNKALQLRIFLDGGFVRHECRIEGDTATVFDPSGISLSKNAGAEPATS